MRMMGSDPEAHSKIAVLSGRKEEVIFVHEKELSKFVSLRAENGYH